MSILQHLETVSLEPYIAIKIHCLECIDRDLSASSILRDVGLAFESQVGGDWSAWEGDFRVLAGREDG